MGVVTLALGCSIVAALEDVTTVADGTLDPDAPISAVGVGWLCCSCGCWGCDCCAGVAAAAAEVDVEDLPKSRSRC